MTPAISIKFMRIFRSILIRIASISTIGLISTCLIRCRPPKMASLMEYSTDKDITLLGPFVRIKMGIPLIIFSIWMFNPSSLLALGSSLLLQIFMSRIPCLLTLNIFKKCTMRLIKTWKKHLKVQMRLSTLLHPWKTNFLPRESQWEMLRFNSKEGKSK